MDAETYNDQVIVVPSFVALYANDLYLHNRLLNLLESQDIFYGEAGQTPVHDWQLPRVHLSQLDIKQVQNLLSSLLEVVAADPFRPDIAKLPEFKKSLVALHALVPQDLLNTLLVIEVIPPGYQLTPPLKGLIQTLRTAIRSQDAVTVDRLLNLLLGQDTIYDGPGKVPTYDWTGVPKGYRRALELILDQRRNLTIQLPPGVFVEIPGFPGHAAACLDHTHPVGSACVEHIPIGSARASTKPPTGRGQRRVP